jgi:hypothetical protein
VFSRSSSQDVKSRAKTGAARVQSRAYQAKAGAVRAQGRAREVTSQASTQVAPLAKSAQEKAGRGLLEARAWAAPRVEAGGVAVQERIAPAVASAMVNAARTIEPPKAKRRRRWPLIVAGIVVLGAGCAAAAQVLRSKQNAAATAASEPVTPPAEPPSAPAERQEMGDTAHVDANGQVRTP